MKLRVVALAALLALACTASLASAEEVTRDSYKAQVEPICKTDTEANERILSGVRQDVRKGKLALAGKKFARAATALLKAYRQLKTVPQPPADEARLTKWLSYIKQEAELFQTGAKALKAGKKSKVQRIVVKLNRTANLANSTVLSFSFHYCKLQPSKFT